VLTTLLFVAVCFVAFTNGANANFKGVASLYGSGTTTLRRALIWGTVTTFAGSVAALFLAQGLLKKFSGRGIVPDSLVASPAFVSALAIHNAGALGQNRDATLFFLWVRIHRAFGAGFVFAVSTALGQQLVG
jgi:phosphate/sulfate permease